MAIKLHSDTRASEREREGEHEGDGYMYSLPQSEPHLHLVLRHPRPYKAFDKFLRRDACAGDVDTNYAFACSCSDLCSSRISYSSHCYCYDMWALRPICRCSSGNLPGLVNMTLVELCRPRTIVLIYRV